jgi:hypothetical protein
MTNSTDQTQSPGPESEPNKEEAPLTWYQFIDTRSDADIIKRFTEETQQILSKYSSLSQYCVVALIDPEGSIGTWQLDKIFAQLKKDNAAKEKDVLFMLLSTGGSIEPAYQISKLCKTYSKSKFVVSIPRQAKSAATLLAIGADEIHMGLLGQLGPIDPQLGGLPALGVIQALETIASLSQRFPGSSQMFALYLKQALTVEQIGYCERISVSAAQYAERLLSSKTNLPEKPATIAQLLVKEYKHHGFVIDLEEARQHLGHDWVISESAEVSATEEIYSLFKLVNLFLEVYKNKRLFVIGGLEDIMIWDIKQ